MRRLIALIALIALANPGKVYSPGNRSLYPMAGLDPPIHVLVAEAVPIKTWTRGSRPREGNFFAIGIAGNLL